MPSLSQANSSLARCVMVLGTSSGAGKSWITTALCRHYARQGLKVAPFKAQNMSNNARVVAPTLPASHGSLPPEGVLAALGRPGGGSEAPTLPASHGSLPPEGALATLGRPSGGSVASASTGGAIAWGEIGSAQYFQALPWRGRSERVWPQIAAALDALRAENDVVVIEGAGSPAEINLMASDVVNLRVARHADARCLLVTDIDRGGAFAHLYGTWALLAPDDRARIAGFVLNKFRGDASLLAPAPEQLQQLTGVPTVAVVPMRFGHGLPEEDGVFDDADSLGFQAKSASGAQSTGAGSYIKDSIQADSPRHIAIVAYPRISNLDEFQPLKNVPGLRVVWARTPAQLAGADTVVLPGSKATAADLAWLRAQGLDAAIAQHAAQGGRVLGVCGGLQMLGEAIIDLHGVEPAAPTRAGAPALPGGDGWNGPGLGLLPLVTTFEPGKTVQPARASFGTLAGAWSALSGVRFSGYEIHSGQTAQHPAMAAKGDVAREVVPGLAWQNAAGNVLGCYVHGLLEDAAVLRALFGAAAPSLDDVFDGLADQMQAAFAPGVLDGLVA